MLFHDAPNVLKEFEAFVDLIAKDLAKAAINLAKWFVNKAIPAIKEFMAAVTKAGGPIEFLKMKWEEIKTTAKMVLAIIASRVLAESNKIRNFFGRAIDSIKTLWLILKLSIITTLNSAAQSAQAILTGMANNIKGVFNAIIGSIETAINAAIRVINPFIALFNTVSDATGGRKLDPLGRVTLPRLQKGGIATDPTLALVGDTGRGNPEVIAPLDDLVNILREVFSGSGIGGPSIDTVQVIVNADPGGAPLSDVGRISADSFVREMRARGIQFSAR